jgi:hypothetical protein
MTGGLSCAGTSLYQLGRIVRYGLKLDEIENGHMEGALHSRYFFIGKRCDAADGHFSPHRFAGRALLAD